MWRDIKGYEGYQVSDDGRVRTHNKVSVANKHGERHWKDRIMKERVCANGKRGGDARVTLWKDGTYREYKISRLVAFTFLGGDINDTSLTVNHIDGDWKNNNLSNLEIISLADNIRHGFETGLYEKNCKKTTVTNIETSETKTFRSMAMASRFMGKDDRYVSRKKNEGIFSNESYVWEIS